MKKIVITSVASLAIASTLMAGVVPPTCNGCHGPDGSRNTIAKEAVPNQLAAKEIVAALEGYKAGTRNKFGKGAMMVNFAKPLTDAQIKGIADAWGKK